MRDGHHRISVARAFGQQSIEAEVTVWDVSVSLPVPTKVVQGAVRSPRVELTPRALA